MLKPILYSIAVIGTLFLAGCGEDSSTEPRVNYITMINATQNSIESNFDGAKEDILTKEKRGEFITQVGEAPEISYDGSHKKTLSANDGFSGYIATTCDADGFLYHTGASGDLRIVNTSSKDITAEVAGNDILVASCSVVKTAVTVSKDSIKIVINGTTQTIDSNGETVWDSVVFSDDSFKNFSIKSIKL